MHANARSPRERLRPRRRGGRVRKGGRVPFTGGSPCAGTCACAYCPRNLTPITQPAFLIYLKNKPYFDGCRAIFCSLRKWCVILTSSNFIKPIAFYSWAWQDNLGKEEWFLVLFLFIKYLQAASRMRFVCRYVFASVFVMLYFGVSNTEIIGTEY